MGAVAPVGIIKSMNKPLTHFDNQGQAHMVDVGAKTETHRVAKASGRIAMQAATLALIKQGSVKKGDVLGIARIAAIQASKRTAELIPLCHPISLTRVAVEITIDDTESSIELSATVECTGKTGVEMEALTAVQIGLLTIYDMCKAVDRGMTMTDIRLLEKHGGKSGSYISNTGGSDTDAVCIDLSDTTVSGSSVSSNGGSRGNAAGA